MLAAPDRLTTRVTRILAGRVMDQDRRGRPLVFPKEADLCLELGVSRTVIRESMKVLADKGMVEIKPRAGTRARPRSHWRLLDPDILAWQAESHPSAEFLRGLCEMIEERLSGSDERRTVGDLPACPDVCPIDCCAAR